MGAGAVGRPNNRAQIMGIGDLIAHDDQGLFVLCRRVRQNILHADVLPHRRQGDDPLMGMGAAHAVQLPPVGFHHDDARRAGLGSDMSQSLVRFPLLDENLIDAGFRPQGLDHRVAAFDEAVGLGGQLVFSLVRHIKILSNLGICQNLYNTAFSV